MVTTSDVVVIKEKTMTNEEITAKGMMDTLHEMQKRRELCDIFLFAGEESQPAHRCILSSRSHLLRMRFLEKFARNGIESFEVEGISEGSLRSFVDFIYTGSLGVQEIPFKVVDEVLTAAQNLQIVVEKQTVLDYFQRFIQYSHFKEVLDLAERINMKELNTFALAFAAENIGEFMVEGHETFCHLSIHELTEILSRREMQSVPSRVQVKAVVMWCFNEFHEQAECLDILLRYVSLNQTLKRTLLCQIQRIQDQGEGFSDFSDVVDQIFHNEISLNESTFNSESVIFISGGEGDDNNRPSDMVFLFDPMENSIVHQTHLPFKCLDHSATVMDGKLFIAGGQRSPNAKSKDSTNNFCSYDPATNEWMALPSMQKSRSVFSLLALDGKIYAVAGKNSQGSLASVERYDLSTDSWSYVAHTYTGLFGHAGTTYDGTLYISGRIVAGRHFTYSLQCYKPKIDKWIHMAPMNHKRAFHAMCRVRDKLYITGGNTCDESGRRIDCDFVEQFCPETDQWTYLISMPRPVSLAGTTTFDGKIFVVGGYSGKKGQKFAEIQKYHVRRNQWSIVGSLPTAVMRLAACSSKS